MRKIIVFLLFSLTLFAKAFLEPSEAFKVRFDESNEQIIINISLGDGIYLYKDKIEVSITYPQSVSLNEYLSFPPTILHDNNEVYEKNLNLIVPISMINELSKNRPYKLQIYYQGCSDNGLCYQPMSAILDKSGLSNDEGGILEKFENSNPFWVLVSFFGFGLLLSLTPCVLPMIPILSSIIVSEKDISPKRGFFLSLIYVLSMSLAYAIAGVIAALGGANIQSTLQNPYALGFFSFIFVLLALSMFGFFELQMPQFLQNLANKRSQNLQKKGIFGIALMGFLSALIVGPCVAAPLAGALIYISQSGDIILGGAALFTLSFGMGVPLLIIGASAKKLLPKPGVWMDNVKNIFGIILLGVAIYMIERVLDSKIVLILYSALFVLCGVFLGVFSSFKEANNLQKISKSFGILSLFYAFTLFVGAFLGGSSLIDPLPNFKEQHISQNDFQKVKNLSELQKIVANSKKPVLVDFWASWCVSCKEMDRFVFADEEVKNELKNFTLVKVDVSDNSSQDEELLKRFNLFGPPAVVFFNNGAELTNLKIIGFKPKDEFLKIVRSL